MFFLRKSKKEILFLLTNFTEKNFISVAFLTFLLHLFGMNRSSHLGKILLSLALFASPLTATAQQSNKTEKITIESKKGKKIEVTLLNFEGDKVKIKLANGRITALPINKLSEKSQTMLKELQTSRQAKEKQQHAAAGKVSEKINTAVGHTLFSGNKALWNTSVDQVARQLRWPKESQTVSSSSFRRYTPASYGFLNARPYSAVIYGDAKGNVSRLSLVFANKGDYNSKVGMGQDHFKPVNDAKKEIASLSDAMQRDAQNIGNVLTKALGTPITQRYGERQERTKVQRWDFQDHSFILSNVKGEYVRLLIVPKTVADAEGKEKFLSDMKLKKELSKNIEKNDFGDVFIKNIPMVNQGPKGYCAPATFERAMRYMRVPADMYVLATIATLPEGGTNTYKLAQKAKNITRSKARRIKDFDSEKLTVRSVKKFINKGVPILWTMRSLEEYNKIANSYSKARIGQEDPAVWKKELEEKLQGKTESLRNVQKNHHICMIIGYNEESQELAVSDSWGPRYEIRWVHISLAAAVSQSGSFVIDF